ncbi:hypothetical protein ACFFRR_002136 [Megaselia abdita]
MNRSNSFVNSIKWWNSNNSTTNSNSSNTNVSNSGNTNGHRLPHQQLAAVKSVASVAAFGSSVAVQKLRESRWFKSDEQKLFCAVVECGFIVEVRSEQTDVENVDSWFGVVLCKTAKVNGKINKIKTHIKTLETSIKLKILEYCSEEENKIKSRYRKTADNKSKPETIEITSIKVQKNGAFKIFKMTLNEIWAKGWVIRINNFNDREKTPHPEKDIKNQIQFARKVKQSLWHNSKHFAFWCRYGSRQQDIRRRQMSECVKWGSVGMNAGILLLMNKQKSHSTSK